MSKSSKSKKTIKEEKKTETKKLIDDDIENTNLLHDPYTMKDLSVEVKISPRYLNNDFEMELKNEIVNLYEKKICQSYGIITKIYKIYDWNELPIDSEDQSCCQKYNVRILISLCMPICKHEIICKIHEITEEIISGKNGPIECIILPSMINTNIFYKDVNNNLRKRKNNELLKEGDYVRVFINTLTFHRTDNNAVDYNCILVTTNLVDNATDEEITRFEENLINYDVS